MQVAVYGPGLDEAFIPLEDTRWSWVQFPPGPPHFFASRYFARDDGARTKRVGALMVWTKAGVFNSSIIWI